MEQEPGLDQLPLATVAAVWLGWGWSHHVFHALGWSRVRSGAAAKGGRGGGRMRRGSRDRARGSRGQEGDSRLGSEAVWGERGKKR